MHDPDVPYLEATCTILLYLKSALEKGILFSNHNQLWLEAYTDADWAGSPVDRH